MQIIAVYACVRVLSEAIAQLPLLEYQYTGIYKGIQAKSIGNFYYFEI